MPDYTMCASASCPSTAKCKRHEASGTVPSKHMQSYTSFEPDTSGYCEGYWPKYIAKTVADTLSETMEKLK